MATLTGASIILGQYIGTQLLKYKKEGLTKGEKKLLKDCIQALEALGFNDLYYNYNERFKAIEESKKPVYELYKKGVLIKRFKSKKEAIDYYYDLLPFAKLNELELIEKEFK